MKYAFTYIDIYTGYINTEITSNWSMYWNYERKGEIKILHIEMIINEENSFSVYDINY